MLPTFVSNYHPLCLKYISVCIRERSYRYIADSWVHNTSQNVLLSAYTPGNMQQETGFVQAKPFVTWRWLY
jgi:hypothetical protein